MHYMEETEECINTLGSWDLLSSLIIKVSRFSRLVNVLRDLKLVTYILCVILEHAWRTNNKFGME